MKRMRGFFAIGLLAAAFAATVPAHAERDAVQFFGNIEVRANEPVHDAVCFFCNVDLQGKATGDIVVFFGNIRLNGEAQHDMVDFFGVVRAEDNSSIGHDLVSFFGSVRLGENVTVGHDMVSGFGVVHASPSVSVGKSCVLLPAWLLCGPLGVLLLLFFVAVYVVREHHQRWAPPGYPMPPRF